ncbi:MAG TPA: beta-phosphoglucomutase family hydrolase [Acidimicrobiales bacterium]|nr:beta-phosphoglucomutase family hydrolase [Acidimicrobiales bacterium]
MTDSSARAHGRELGLPAFDGWLFDLDGVLTDTARIHVQAWQATFDAILQHRAGEDSFVSFDPEQDYERFVDGKPRADGVRDFLRSRGIELPEGERSDPADRLTVWGVGNRKNDLFLALLSRHAPTVFPGSVRLVHAVRGAGSRTAVVSASENCRSVLESAGILGDFDVVVDGVVAISNQLAGKPAPDTFLFAADRLGVAPRQAVVVEDAPAGVTAGRRGGFGWVVGVARRASPSELEESGADVVVRDLAELLGEPPSGGTLRANDG